MPEKKERWGAYIKLKDKDPKGYSDRRVLDYEIRLGRAGMPLEKNEGFTSTAKISERIAEINAKWKLEGKEFCGYIYPQIKHGEKVIIFGAYFPISRRSRIPEELRNSLRSLGFASRVELRVLRDLEKRFPGHLYQSQATKSTEPRKQQHKKRGTYREKAIPIREEIQQIADYLGEEGIRRREKNRGVARLLAARKRNRARRRPR